MVRMKFQKFRMYSEMKGDVKEVCLKTAKQVKCVNREKDYKGINRHDSGMKM